MDLAPSPWWTTAVIYELYVDKFAGNFTNLTAKLDYFTYLGVNTLWVLPHYPSPGIDGGYDISDFTHIRPDLGSVSDFQDFVKQAHAKHLRVIIDLVLNHTSATHPWFIASRSSRNNPKRDWYMWSENQTGFSQAFVHFEHIKGKNWIYNPTTGDYYYATFYQEQPDLNWDNPEVFAAMMAVIDFWLGLGVDGFRLDAVSRLIKREGTNCFALPQTHELLKHIRTHIDSKYSDILLLAESGGWIHEAKPFFGSGDECQLVIHFPLAVELLSAILTRDLSQVHAIWDQSRDIPDTCRWAVFLTSHDSVDLFFLTSEEQKRQLARLADPTGYFSTPTGASIGARLAEVCQGKEEAILWAVGQLLSQPGVPVIYYGNEIGLRNAPLSPKPSDIRDFVRGPFDWAEADRQKSDPSSLLSHIRTLLQNRSC
jgi:maltose alpha-D-glucosyltransferase/alpha-amylase